MKGIQNILAWVLAKKVTYCYICMNGKDTARLCRQILSSCFDPNDYKTKKSKSQRSVLTLLFDRQPICAAANFFSRGGSDRPYFLTFLARTEASMIQNDILGSIYSEY